MITHSEAERQGTLGKGHFRFGLWVVKGLRYIKLIHHIASLRNKIVLEVHGYQDLLPESTFYCGKNHHVFIDCK